MTNRFDRKDWIPKRPKREFQNSAGNAVFNVQLATSTSFTQRVAFLMEKWLI